MTGAGFKLNPYDPCVANKVIGGTQMTICWNVDDMKISHVDPKAVEKVVSWLDKLYPGITATRGKIHYYLGMTFDSSIPDEVRVSMDDYIEKGH